ncbi:MAG: PAS domain-containing sensor histidine kinase [Candidatus Jettenia sp.]|uniref:histidine kinase n=1 Tax=Candidatus Jettenia caeni TaxID=247490 RepID=I3IHD9_9BACT|nr:ATP-binding protein [Candidatus Jettenia sp. AMX1]MBC6930116.1 PAS domain-containing sensor histidine kinase [Candidatus Jettenia sp.]GAB61134.1 two-component sensor kinase [Candidatus Jettenia caeni]KAA0248132.1 MAG: PAS domain S-box protein [Candidatus Jettenia sp. AMX1]MCE7881741.1 PAS domain-containing sensor histidine kinase [Candidatus Jettenia sp. AMX1]MDL1940212.1 PAS domain S-box protein [Candidatus Jettenia sp. AMX1]
MKNDSTKINQILNQALDSAGKGIMIQDVNRKVVFFNHACEEITRWSKEKIVGKDCGDIFQCHTSTGMCLTEKFCPGVDIFQGKFSKTSRELMITRGDGSESWIEANASAIRDAEGRVTHIVTIMEDIRERKNFADEILKSKTLSTLGTFAAELAHEIKNPLNAMNIQMLVLEREIQDTHKLSSKSKKEFLEIVSIVQKEVIRLSGFVEECLQFSRTGELNKSLVNIGEMLNEITSLLLPQAQLNGIYVELDVMHALPKVKVDKDKMKQAILNILINGIEAMPDGGEMRVGVHYSHDGILISCQDTGPGIPDEIQDKIFNLFYTTKNGGTGIGLSFAQNIVQAHGGTIRLEQTPKGSKFIIAIPVNENNY